MDGYSRWNRGAVLAHLSGYTVSREVDSGGSISLGNRGRYVGTALKGKRVFVSLDPQAVEWVVADKNGVCYHRLKAEELSDERIIDVSDKSPE